MLLTDVAMCNVVFKRLQGRTAALFTAAALFTSLLCVTVTVITYTRTLTNVANKQVNDPL